MANIKGAMLQEIVKRAQANYEGGDWVAADSIAVLRTGLAEAGLGTAEQDDLLTVAEKVVNPSAMRQWLAKHDLIKKVEGKKRGGNDALASELAALKAGR